MVRSLIRSAKANRIDVDAERCLASEDEEEEDADTPEEERRDGGKKEMDRAGTSRSAAADISTFSSIFLLVPNAPIVHAYCMIPNSFFFT